MFMSVTFIQSFNMADSIYILNCKYTILFITIFLNLSRLWTNTCPDAGNLSGFGFILEIKLAILKLKLAISECKLAILKCKVAILKCKVAISECKVAILELKPRGFLVKIRLFSQNARVSQNGNCSWRYVFHVPVRLQFLITPLILKESFCCGLLLLILRDDLGK